MIFYFSGTGNSLWLANQIAEATGEHLVSIAEASVNQDFQYTLNFQERIGFVFPVYGWSMPGVVKSFIQNLDLQGYKENYCFFAATCGDDMGTTETEVQKLLTAKGWTLSSAFAVKMPNTYVCLPGFDVDKTELEEQKLRETVGRTLEICRMALERREGKHMTIPGAMPWTKTHILGGFFRKFLMDCSKFHASEECISCGKCVSSCPMHNITLVEGRPQWGTDCTMCLSCYHHCPQHAIQYGNQTRHKGQYIKR